MHVGVSFVDSCEGFETVAGLKMQKCKWLFAGALTLLSCTIPVKAEILAYVFQGTVDQLTDNAGVFGSPLPGATYQLTYLADFSVGRFGGGGGGFGGGEFLTGGTSVEPNPDLPPGTPPDPEFLKEQISPISASLEINGRALEFSGRYFGEVSYYHNSSPSTGASVSWADLYAENRSSDGTVLNQITSHLESPLTGATFQAIDRPVSLVVDGNTITGSTNFSYIWAKGTAGETVLSGSLNPTLYTVSAVPEPAQWVLLALGVAGIGFGSLRSKRAAASA